MTRSIHGCSVEVSASDVDAGTDIVLEGKVSCALGADLGGQTLVIKEQDGALLQSVELSEFDGNTRWMGKRVLTAPTNPGVYTWWAVLPAHATANVSHGETSTPFSFTVKPHRTRVVTWDTPSAVGCGQEFRVKVGVKCSSDCPPDGWMLEVHDHDGNKRTEAALSDAAWPGTAALYYAEVKLRAPETEGLYSWEARAPAAGRAVPHTDGIARFGVRVVAAPECVLTVQAIEMESQTPVRGAKVVVHPYRAFTDEHGLAKVRVPRGAYRLFVSGKDYFPFRIDGVVNADMTIKAELALDLELSDADVWS
jgi:hypothetical protein